MKERPTSPRKRTTKPKGHRAFPGTEECFATRRTASDPKVHKICVERMIQKCNEKGNRGVAVDKMHVAASNEANTYANAYLSFSSFEEILESGPFTRKEKLVFYDGPADSASDQAQGDPHFQPQSPRPSALPSSSRSCPATPLPPSSASGSRPPSTPPRSHTRRDTHKKKSYNGRPIVPDLPQTSKSPPRLSGSHKTMESMRSGMLCPLGQQIAEYISAGNGRFDREELVGRVVDDWGIWKKEDVVRQLRAGPFMEREGMVYMKGSRNL